MSNTTIQERIKLFVDAKDITIRKFEVRCGLSGGYVARIKNISYDKQANIKAAYPDLNMVWLLTGQGSMLNNVNQSNIDIDCSEGKKDSHNTYTANGSNSVAGHNVRVEAPKEKVDELIEENEKLRKELSSANDKALAYLEEISQLKGQIIELYRNSIKK